MPSTSVPPPAIDVLPAEGARDPDLWVIAAAWTTVVFALVQILMFPFGRDQGIYAMVASGLLDGKIPYRDVWDFKPPAIFFTYAASFLAFGESMLAPRVLEAFGLIGLVFGFRRLGLTYFGSRTAGLLGAAVAALTHAQLEFWHTGQPETFGTYLVVLAIVLTSHDFTRSRNRTLAWVAIGMAFGCAFLFKPPLGGGAPVCAAYIARRIAAERTDRLRILLPVVIIGASSLLPIAVCALWFWVNGGWPELFWTLAEFTPGYTSLGWTGRSAPAMFYYATQEAFFKFSALLGVGFIAAIALRPVHSREREGIFLLSGIASVHLAGIAMQGKFFPYHYAATLPLLALVSGLGWYKLWRRCLGQGTGAGLAFAAFVLVVASMRQAVYDLPYSFWQRSAFRIQYLLGIGSEQSRAQLEDRLYRAADFSLGANRRVAEEVAARSAVDDTVYVWGFEPSIYWLSDRAPSSRFIYNVPQRARWQQQHARDLLFRDLKSSPPSVVVVQHNDIFPAVTGDSLDSSAALDEFRKLDELLTRHYELVNTVEDFEVYERSPEGLASTPH